MEVLDVRQARVLSEPVRKEEGTVSTVNERIDLSVFRRCQLDPAYRPHSLEEWARRKKLDLNEIIAYPEAHPYCEEVRRIGIEAPEPEVPVPA
jgi:hypothetical protein